MSIVAMSNENVNAFKPLKPIGPPVGRPREVRRKPRRSSQNPRSTWPAWTDRYSVTIVEDDEPRPTPPPDFIPTADLDAEWSGQSLAYFDALMVAAPSEWGVMRSSSFRIGQADGMIARHRREDRDEIDRLYYVLSEAHEALPPRETDGFMPGYCS